MSKSCLSPIQQEREFLFDAFRHFLSEKGIPFEERGYSLFSRCFDGDLHSDTMFISTRADFSDDEDFWDGVVAEFMAQPKIANRESGIRLEVQDYDIYELHFTIRGIEACATFWCGYENKLSEHQCGLPLEHSGTLHDLLNFVVEHSGDDFTENGFYSLWLLNLHDDTEQYLDRLYCLEAGAALDFYADLLDVIPEMVLQSEVLWGHVSGKIKSGEWTRPEQLAKFFLKLARHYTEFLYKLAEIHGVSREQLGEVKYVEHYDFMEGYEMWFSLLDAA